MIGDEPDQRMTPELRTCLIAAACVRMKKALTLNEQEEALQDLIELVREPTT